MIKDYQIHLVSMIRDEEEVIERMISKWTSVLPIDTIDILDTGSVDNTLEIISNIKGHTISVSNTYFINFVASKNQLLDDVYERYNTGKHIIIFSDADEFPDDTQDWKKTVTKFINSKSKSLYTYINDIDSNSNPTISYKRVRLWKFDNENRYKFQGPNVHEYLDDGDCEKTNTDLIVFHKHKSNKDYYWNFTRYIKYMSEYLSVNQGINNGNDMRAYFYLGQTYQILKRYEEAIIWYNTYIDNYDEKIYKHKSELYNSYLNLGICYMYNNDIEQSIKTFNKLIDLNIEQRREAHYYLAKILLDIPEYYDLNRASKIINKALNIDVDNINTMFLDIPINFTYINGLKAWIDNKLLETKNNDKINTNKYNINDYFDKIYLINLDRRKDRLSHADSILNEYNIRYEKVEGYDGRLLNFMVNNEINGQTTGGYIGCNLTHLSLHNRAKDNNYNNFLVFEDDILIHKDFNKEFDKLINSLENDNIRWDILYLGSMVVAKKDNGEWRFIHNKFDKPYFKVDDKLDFIFDDEKLEIYGCHAIAFSKNVYETILKSCENGIIENYDNLLFELIRKKQISNVYCSSFQLFTQDADSKSNNHNSDSFRFDTDNYLNKYYSVYQDYK